MKKKCAGVASSRLNKIIAAAESLASRGSKSWYDKLKPSDRSVVDELKAEYLTGNYPNLNASSIAKAVSAEIGVEISGQAMRSWLRKSK